MESPSLMPQQRLSKQERLKNRVGAQEELGPSNQSSCVIDTSQVSDSKPEQASARAMYGLQKRLERLKSTATISGAFPDSPSGGAAAARDPAAGAPAATSEAARAQAPEVSEQQKQGENFSVLLTGISKKSCSPELIRRAVEECLRSNFSFAPKVLRLVDRVEFCRHPIEDSHFAVIVFASRLMAELFVEVHASKGLAFLPFLPEDTNGDDGDQQRVKVATNHRSAELGRVELLGARKDGLVYLSGLPSSWANSDRLRERFEELLMDARRDLGLNLVKLVQVLGSGAAIVGFKSKVVVDLLMYKCKTDRSCLASIGTEVLIVSAKGDRFHSLKSPSASLAHPSPGSAVPVKQEPGEVSPPGNQLRSSGLPSPPPQGSLSPEKHQALVRHDSSSPGVPKEKQQRICPSATKRDSNNASSGLRTPPAKEKQLVLRTSPPIREDVDDVREEQQRKKKKQEEKNSTIQEQQQQGFRTPPAKQKQLVLKSSPPARENGDASEEQQQKKKKQEENPTIQQQQQQEYNFLRDSNNASSGLHSPLRQGALKSFSEKQGVQQRSTKPDDNAVGIQQQQQQQQQRPRLAGVEQRSLYLTRCRVENFNRQKLVDLMTIALERASPGSAAADRDFQLRIDIDSCCLELVFSSPAIVDKLMDLYLTHTQQLQIDGFPFAIARHKLYSRPGAAYRVREHPPRPMTLTISGLRGLNLHPQILQGAIAEALERHLAGSGVLVAGNPVLENLSLTYMPGLDSAVISIEDLLASKLLSITNNLLISGRRLSIMATGSDQSTLVLTNLPTATAKHDPTALNSIVRFMLRKHQSELAVSFIADVNWPVCSNRAYIVFHTEAVADAFMDDYIAHTDDFCKQELVFTIYRHNSYVRPGTIYSRSTTSSPVVRSLTVMGIQESMHPMPLRGAIIELLDRVLAGTGVLKKGQPSIRHFYYLKGNTSAVILVEEPIAQILVELPGLTLAGLPLRIIPTELVPAPSPVPDPVPVPALPSPVPAAPEAAACTGGWIELEEGEMLS